MPAATMVRRRPRLMGTNDEYHDYCTTLMESFQKRGYNLCSSLSPSRSDSTSDTASSSSSSSSGSGSVGEHYPTSTSNSSSFGVLSLREPKQGQSVLHLAIRKGDTDILNAVLKLPYSNALINARDVNGNTPLHFAVAKSKYIDGREATQKLINSGANINAENNRGMTPIVVHILTLRSDQTDILQMLLENGADPNAMDEEMSLLHHAVYKGFQNVACKLVDFGASITTIDTHGLMVCEIVERSQLIKLISCIRYAPPIVPPTIRNTCMKCHTGVFMDTRKPRKGLVRWLRNLFSCIKLTEYANCCHCGLIFCSSCIKMKLDDQALPSTLQRKDLSLDLVDCSRPQDLVCEICTSVLCIRKKKGGKSEKFFQRLLGWG